MQRVPERPSLNPISARHLPGGKFPCHTSTSAIKQSPLFILNGLSPKHQQAWWACSTGLTLCVHGEVLNSPTTKKFCILVQLVPRITYYSEEVVLKYLVGHVGGNLLEQKREPISLSLAAILGTGLAVLGTGNSCPNIAEKEL